MRIAWVSLLALTLTIPAARAQDQDPGTGDPKSATAEPPAAKPDDAEKPAPPEDPRTQEAQRICQEAYDALEKAKTLTGDERKDVYEAALAAFRRVTKDFRDTRPYGMAHYNTGVVLTNYLGLHDEAVQEFQDLIDSEVDDKDDTGQLMSPYRNYRYHAWRMMAACFGKLDKPGHVIDAHLHSRSAYISDCGTCQKDMESSVAKQLIAAARAIAPQATDADLTACLEQAKEGPAFLLAFARRLQATGGGEEAKDVLRVLTAEFPNSPAAVEAGKESK